MCLDTNHCLGGKVGVENYNTTWLPHLPNEVVADARGWNLDAYVVALEGWRRGLTLRWHTKDSEKFKEMKTWFVNSPGRLFSLSSEEKTHYFFRTRGDLVPNEAVEIGSDKAKTKKVLAENNIPVPEGREFNRQVSDEEIMEYAKKIGFPVVLKPTDGSFGRGVMTNIKDSEQFNDALSELRNKHDYENIIVEQHISGDDYRIYVVGDKPVAAMKRVPANVIGDGKQTIRELIDEKNEIRKKNPRLISCLIQIDEELKTFLASQQYTLDDVLEEGKRLFLTNKSNISTGGDPINVTDSIAPEIMDTAVRALQSIPGLIQGAVDMIVDSRKRAESAATVIELNPTSQIGGLLFPMIGEPSDVPSAIIDYYFPETKHVRTDKEKMYFDFIDVLSPLESKATNVSMVTPMPLGKIYAKKYTVVGDVQNFGYHMGLRKQAFQRKLSGVVLNREDGSIDVAVAGTDPEMVNDFENGLWEDPERSTVEEVYKSDWNHPLKVGFEIKGDLKTQLDEIERLKQDIERTEHELKIAEKKQKKYYDSLSWKITAPIRLIGYIIKKFRKPRI